jgi:hypothetical protein
VRISTRTGAQSITRALRLMLNDLLGTRFRREPAWLSAPLELVVFLCGLFGYFGAGRDLRATACKPESASERRQRDGALGFRCGIRIEPAPARDHAKLALAIVQLAPAVGVRRAGR